MMHFLLIRSTPMILILLLVLLVLVLLIAKEMVSGDNNMIGDSTVVIDRKIDLNFFMVLFLDTERNKKIF